MRNAIIHDRFPDDKGFKNTPEAVFNKGFCDSLDAAMEGQKCLQPKHSKGEMQFEGKDTLHSACMAVTCSGNECAVQ